jgi:hypothetical protein
MILMQRLGVFITASIISIVIGVMWHWWAGLLGMVVSFILQFVWASWPRGREPSRQTDRAHVNSSTQIQRLPRDNDSSWPTALPVPLAGTSFQDDATCLLPVKSATAAVVGWPILGAITVGMLLLWPGDQGLWNLGFWEAFGVLYSALMFVVMNEKRKADVRRFSRQMSWQLLAWLLGLITFLGALNLFFIRNFRPELAMGNSGISWALPVPTGWNWLPEGLIAALPSVGIAVLIFYSRVTFFCPHCGKCTNPAGPWICGFCDRQNGGPDGSLFYQNCKHCGKAAEALRCPSCREVIRFVRDGEARHFARLANEPAQVVVLEKADPFDEEMKTLDRELSLKRRLLESKKLDLEAKRLALEIDEVDYKRARRKIAADDELVAWEEGVARETRAREVERRRILASLSPKERARRHLDESMESQLQVNEAVAEKKKAIMHKYADDPDMRDTQLAALEAAKEELLDLLDKRTAGGGSV